MRQTEPPAVFIQQHLGCGDNIVCLPIYRHFAQTFNVLIPVKRRNVPSIQFMVRGLAVAILAVDDDEGMKRLAAVAEKRHHVLKLGMFGKNFDEKHWCESMYSQAGVPFEKRWSDWKIERDLSREIQPPTEQYIFFHQDSTRNFIIDLNRVPTELPCAIPVPGKTDNIFDYCRLVEEAEEIHCIDSCFAILADSLTTLKAKRKVIHLYARKGALPPTYRGDWEILK